MDSLNMWPYVSGAASASPRTRLHGDVDMLIDGEYKLITAATKGACWGGPQFPNASTAACTATDCGGGGCLYNVRIHP